jgi:hypothetical protein
MLIILFLFLQSWAIDKSCSAGAPITSNSMTAGGLNTYLQSNKAKIRDIGDLICCLPKEYQSNFVVGYDSIAGQPGSIQSPRILMFNQLRDPKKMDFISNELRAIVTANGGDPSLMQFNNLEAMFNPSDKKEVELRDYELQNGNVHMSGPNPESCMNCHSSMAGEPGGPRANFEPFGNWTRFLDGIIPCSETEKNLMTEIQNKTYQKIVENPRFRCLDHSKIKDGQFDLLSQLDIPLRKISNRRTAQIVKSTPDYQSYKYAILGAGLCRNFQEESFNDPSTWLPPEVKKRHHSRELMSKDVRESTDIWKTLKDGTEKERAAFIVMEEKQKKMISDFQLGKIPQVDFYRGAFCGSKLTQTIRLGGVEQKVDAIDSSILFARKYIPDSLHRIFVDGLLKKMRNSGANDADIRYLFEGRGIDTSGWNRSATPGGNSKDGLQDLVEDLLALEPKLSPLKSIEPAIKNLEKIDNLKEKISLQTKLCKKLRDMSLNAFKNMSQDKTEKTKTVR